jgi:VanZ family protein
MNRRIQTYLSSKWPAIFWSAIIFILLAFPNPDLLHEKRWSFTDADKIVHVVLFFILVWLWAAYLKSIKGKSAILLFAIAFAATSYGILMEFVQIYTGRDFSTGDMIADAAGAFLAAFISLFKK